MRKAFLLIPSLLLLAACESSRNIDGKDIRCVGLNGRQLPAYEYEYSAHNIIVGIIFAEVVAPPVVVLLDELKCPVVPTTGKP